MLETCERSAEAGRDVAASLVKERYAKVIAALELARSSTMDLDGEEQDVDVFPNELDEQEKCAACQEVIPFGQLGKGTCRNGHSWGEFLTL